MNPDELGKWLSEFLDKATNDLSLAGTKSGKKILAELEAMTGSLIKDAAGNIKPTKENLMALARARDKISRTVINPEWQKAVRVFEGRMKEAELTVKTYMLEVYGNEFNSNAPVFAAIRENSILLTRESLLSSGITKELTQPLQQILLRSVTAGIPYRDLIAQARLILEENGGRLSRWVKQIVNDQATRYVRNYIHTAAQGLDSEWFRYSGGLVRDSRPFCVLRAGKDYHISEIRSWATQEWAGKDKLTTAENIIDLLGGYNCPHIAIPVMEKSVDASRRKAFEKEPA